MADTKPEGSNGEGISIYVNEVGAQQVTDSLDAIASSFERLSPAFAKTIRGRALRAGANIEKQLKNASKAILENVVRRTPHDTGRARRHWHTSIGEPDTSVNWDDKDYDGEATIAEGKAKIDAQTKLAPGVAIVITNPLNYIKFLNNGHSQQAPAAFVETAVQAGVETVRGARGTLFNPR